MKINNLRYAKCTLGTLQSVQQYNGKNMFQSLDLNMIWHMCYSYSTNITNKVNCIIRPITYQISAQLPHFFLGHCTLYVVHRISENPLLADFFCADKLVNFAIVKQNRKILFFLSLDLAKGVILRQKCHKEYN